LIDGYDGTVMLVSHDRDFLDRVTVTTIAMEGDGKATAYAGGWSDYQSQRRPAESREEGGKTKGSGPKSKQKSDAKPGLSFTEKHRLEVLPAEMARIEAEIVKLQDVMSDPALFTENPVKFGKATDALIERQARLDDAEEEWLMLEEKAAG
jgi:ATP-binding cassette subfamily F protein uup